LSSSNKIGSLVSDNFLHVRTKCSIFSLFELHNKQVGSSSFWYILPTKFHEILFSSFRGVALTNCVTDRRTGQKQYVSPPKWECNIPYWNLYIYICTRVYHNVTISLKKFFITNPLILEEQNSFKIIGTWAEQFSGTVSIYHYYTRYYSKLKFVFACKRMSPPRPTNCSQR
jgi:hypothetical protein